MVGTNILVFNKNMTRFTIITTLYNQKKFLPQLIKSLEAQTFKDFEVIFCDDGSKDGTKEYFKNSKYQYYRNRFDFGMRMAKVVNKGLKRAKGEYIVMIMGDSYPPADYLEKLDKIVKDNRVICGVRNHIKDGKLVDVDYRINYGIIPKFDTLLTGQVWKQITGNGLVIPTKWLREIGGWSNYRNYGGDDNSTAFRLWTKGLEFISLYSLVLYHNWHEDRGTKKKNTEQLSNEIIKFFNNKLSLWTRRKNKSRASA